MQQKPKKKQGPKVRLASKRDRDEATRWAAAYRNAEACVWVGPDEEMRPLDGDDLAKILEEFARDGTFCAHERLVPFVRALRARTEFSKLRAAGVTHRNALIDVGEELKVSESTIARATKRSRSGTP